MAGEQKLNLEQERANAMLGELQQQRDFMALRAGQIAGNAAAEIASLKNRIAELEAQAKKRAPRKSKKTEAKTDSEKNP